MPLPVASSGLFPTLKSPLTSPESYEFRKKTGNNTASDLLPALELHVLSLTWMTDRVSSSGQPGCRPETAEEMITIPVVIVDGPDFSGKSTLVEALERAWKRNFPSGRTIVYKNGPPPKFPCEDGTEIDPSLVDPAVYGDFLMRRYIGQIESYSVEDITTLVIVKRWAVSNFVLGNLFRPDASRDGWAELGERNFELVDEAFASKGGILAMLLPSPKILSTRDMMRQGTYLDQLMEQDKAAEPRAELSVRNDSQSVRRWKQLTQISGMFDIWMQEHARRFMTYRHIGCPFFVDRDVVDAYDPPAENDMLIKWDKAANQWPAISFEFDVRLVASRILTTAMDVQYRLLQDITAYEIEREHALLSSQTSV